MCIACCIVIPFRMWGKDVSWRVWCSPWRADSNRSPKEEGSSPPNGCRRSKPLRPATESIWRLSITHKDPWNQSPAGRKDGPMSVKSQDQVKLFDLLFGMSWEDPASDRRALAIQPGETLLTVTSGACNTLTLLLEDPGKVYAVDINPSQSYLLELKRAAVRHLEYDELRAFLGLAPSGERLQIFERLRGDLSEAALGYWRGKPEAVRKGGVNAGKYESFIRLLRRFVGVMQGK